MKFLHKKYENSAMKTDRLMSIKRSVTDRHENVTDRRLWFFLGFFVPKIFFSNLPKVCQQNMQNKIKIIQYIQYNRKTFAIENF